MTQNESDVDLNASLDLLGFGETLRDEDDCRADQTNPMIYQSLDIPVKLYRVKVESYAVQSMAYFIWNAALLMAQHLEQHRFLVCGKRVLELGAGVGLPGLVATLMGADKVILTEYPDPAIVQILEKNRRENLGDRPDLLERCYAMGHAWGQDASELISANDGELFDVILIADCIWMVEQHTTLLQSCIRCLKPQSGQILLTCYPHTGKLNVERFLSLATDLGLKWRRVFEDHTCSPISYQDSNGKSITIGTEILNQINTFILTNK